MKRVFHMLKFSLLFVVSCMICTLFGGCYAPEKDTHEQDISLTMSAIVENETAIVTESSIPTAEDVTTTAPTGTATPVDTVEEIFPTSATTPSKDEVNVEIAETFFSGEWDSSSGMLYIFDGRKGTVVLKEKSTGEVLLEGTYKTYSEDFSEYQLSMTFEGETESFIAWAYSDTGNVKLIIEETGAMYDLLWRAHD